MNILLTGATGYVGRMITRRFQGLWHITGVSAHAQPAADLLRCDLTDTPAVRQMAEQYRPDAIIHAAGNKNLGFCESSPHSAYAANVETTLNLIKAYPETPIIYISSDYVFPGDRGSYRESDAVAPQTVYGRTKACAELAGQTLSEHFITIRLSALYDQDATFLRFLEESLGKGGRVDCFTDAFYSPTYCEDFLLTLQRIIDKLPAGRRVFHACGQRISRFFFARMYARANGYDESLVMQASRLAENVPFLFPDLSLENTHTREFLDLPTSSHKDALVALSKSQ